MNKTMCQRFCVAAFVIALVVSPVFTVLAEDLDKDPHLAGWWTFDNIQGDTAPDASGNGRDATIQNAKPAEGKCGQALEFSGKNAPVVIKGYKGITGNQARTVAAWVKTDKNKGHILSWGTPVGGGMFNYGFYRSGVGIDPQGGYLFGVSKIHDGEWHYVAAVIEKAEEPNLHDHAKLYADGEVEEIGDIGLLDLWPIDTGDELDVTIGNGFTGLIDEVRMYDRALSADEVKQLFEKK